MFVLIFALILSIIGLAALGSQLFTKFKENQALKKAIDKIDKELSGIRSIPEEYQKRTDTEEVIFRQKKYELNSKLLDIEKALKLKNCELRETQVLLAQTAKLLSSIQIDADLVLSMPYDFIYNFDNAPDFERKRKEIQETVKNLNKELFAKFSKHEKHEKAIAQLAIRDFLAETDAMIEAVDYKNIVVYETRVEKIAEAVSKIISPFGVVLPKPLIDLKVKELRVVYEYQEFKYKVTEEQRMIKEAMRDELKDARALEKEQQESEKEAKLFENMLSKALAEAQKKQGTELETLNAKIALLEQQAREAMEKAERAKSMAQQTKRGFVYIISNIGSFGENIYKIGMTRRLEPQERVDELGDASVPFSFDVHAFIDSEDAPALEAAFHTSFANKRLNKVNLRKEFFKVTLDEIVEVAKQHNDRVSFTMIAEAKEYRMSVM